MAKPKRGCHCRTQSYCKVHSQKSRANRAARYARNRRIIEEGKSKPCMDCGGTFHFVAMDFDHVRGEKLFSLGVVQGHSVEKIMAEIAKCDVVCSNCHRIRTWKRRRGIETSNTHL